MIWRRCCAFCLLLRLCLSTPAGGSNRAFLYNRSAETGSLPPKNGSNSQADGRFVRLGSPSDKQPLLVLDLPMQNWKMAAPPLLSPVLLERPDLAPKRRTPSGQIAWMQEEASPEWVDAIDQMLGIQRKPRSGDADAARAPQGKQPQHRVRQQPPVVEPHRGRQPPAAAASPREMHSHSAAGSRPDPQAVGLGANLARIGLRVERGPHWRWGEQDGGRDSIGVVIGEIRQGWCTVRWPSGYTNGYRAGEAGNYDLRVARQSAARPPLQQALPQERRAAVSAVLDSSRSRPGPGTVLDSHLVRPGLKVQRGPDWRWGNQDGGFGSIGIVQGAERHGWVNVRWPSGTENGYRVGDSGKHDLEVAGRHRAQMSRQVSPSPEIARLQHEVQRSQMGNTASTGCAARARTRCWCIDQYGDRLNLP